MTRLTDKAGLAEYLNISPRTVETWTFQRRIPFVRVSPRCVRYDLDAIDRILHERTIPVGGSRKAGRGNRDAA